MQRVPVDSKVLDEGAEAFVDELDERHPLAEPLSSERLHNV